MIPKTNRNNFSFLKRHIYIPSVVKPEGQHFPPKLSFFDTFVIKNLVEKKELFFFTKVKLVTQFINKYLHVCLMLKFVRSQLKIYEVARSSSGMIG